jgi:transcriptional antiterminator RfaH
MPLLAPEPFVYPEGLLADPLPDSLDGSECWWVLHTRPRAEKALARMLHRKAISFFLPVQRRQWRDRGRLLCSYLPLFPSYVFLWGDPYARLAALETNQVAYVLPVPDQQRLSDDLVRVRRLMEAGLPLTPEEQLEPGTLVEIVTGSMAGLTGRVLRRGRQFHFVLEVQMLQRGVSVEIETSMFRPLPAPRSL